MKHRISDSARRHFALLKTVILVLALLLLCTACADREVILPLEGEGMTVEKEPTPDINDVTLQDRDEVYAFDDETSVVTMYLTVRRGNAGESSDHSWQEVNSFSVYDYEAMGVDRYRVEGILQVGNENGPLAGELGYGLNIPNATVQIRGASTSRYAQKSYKIVLKDSSESWRNQKTIALNKHIFDGLRFRNKFCYDLIKQIPDMIGLRTQFVHLYVKDETDGADGGFVDYGLFTQVEQPNTAFLRNHGLDVGGHFYKANFFEFERYPDVIKLKGDAGYDQFSFEQYLEIKGNDDHAKLISMLDDLNDFTKPADEVFERYFDADNYFTWLAFNILLGNLDTQSRNYYLYSPLNSETWYFLAWDCDGAFGRTEYHLRYPELDPTNLGYEYGISNYWGDVLSNRILRLPAYREKLDEEVEEMRAFLTAEKINEMVTSYRAVVEPYVYAMPDMLYARLTPAEYDLVAGSVYKEIEENYRLYKESLENPMPFYMAFPEVQEGQLYFAWDPAFSFKEQDITYTFELASDFRFEQIIDRQEGLAFPSAFTVNPGPGQYFYRVHGTDEDGREQVAMAYYVVDSIKHYGVQSFYILENGEVEGYVPS